MTDEVLNTETSVPTNAEPNVSTDTPSTESSLPSTPSAPTEKMISQSEVDKLVVGVKKGAYEKAERDMMAERQKQSADQPSQDAVSPDNIRKMINEEAKKMAEIHRGQGIINDFSQKILDGKEQYEDYEEVVAPLRLAETMDEGTFASFIRNANDIPNPADMLYEIGKNPSKLGELTRTLKETPHLAPQVFKRLSDSIIANKEAVSAKKVKEPLSQVENSYTGIDSGDGTVSDYRKLDWLR